MNAKEKRYIFYLVAVAFGLVMLVPTGGILTAQAATPSEYVLVDSAHVGDLQQMGAGIFVDYGNGFYLMKMPANAVSVLSQVNFPAIKMSDSAYLDMYPSSYRFIPAKGVPEIDSSLETSSTDIYVIQFVGPIKAQWVKNVQNQGATVLSDVAKYGIIARMSPDTVDSVRNMPEVMWVGPYQPAYKISSKIDVNSDSAGMFSLAIFKGYDPQNVADYLSEQGITVLSVQKSNVIINAPQNKIPLVAGLEEVQSIEGYSQQKTLDLMADKVIHVREVWYPAYTGLSTRFIGTGQVVGIQDTGYDEGDDTAGPNDHFQGPLGDRIVRYKDEGGKSDPDGNNDGVAHGSHCCGLIAGNGWSWEKQYGYSTDDYNWDHAESVGAAPGAKLSIDGIMASSGQGAALSPSTSYWDTEQNDGAEIYSNSWGGSPGDYDNTYSKTVDDNCNSDNRRLTVFAAGNEGPQADTLNPDSQGKDGLCIAASKNFRPDWFDADNPNMMADFSSRGGTLSDTRIKPDLAAPGTADISLNARGEYEFDTASGGPGPDPNWIDAVDQYDWNNKAPGQDGDPDYQYMQGTSMATPIAAGSAAVIRQYLTDTGYSNDPNSQIIKALMINGARRLPNIHYPGYDQGWGLINVKNSILPDPPTTLQYTEATMSSTGTWDAASDGGMGLDVASSDVPLKVTLVWVDTSGVNLNRDLDLYVEAPNHQWYHGNAYGTDGWTMANTTVANSADTWLGSWDRGDGYDGVNNVEQVEVQHPMVGTWTVHVIGANVPSATPFALVVRADIGSHTPQYAVKMDLSGSKTIRVDQGGSAEIPVTVRNYGTSTDTFTIVDNIPTGLNTEYTYGGATKSSYQLAPGKSATFILTITADSTASPGVYPFHIESDSSGDSSVKSVIDLKVAVIDPNEKIPKVLQITDSSKDESNPSVTAFTDSDGNSWIFIAYVVSNPISTDGKYGGDTVMVKYAQLSSNGMPTTWHGPYQLTRLNENPNDIRILHADAGTYQDRVWVIWTGTDPNATSDSNGNKGSWGRIAWADKSDYSSWTCPYTGTNTTIDENSGSNTYNYKRVNSIQYRASSNQLVYVFEHLDYDSNGKIQAVHNGYSVSTDGGASWSAAQDYDPGGLYFFFPNIMDGGVDANGVIWSYVYHRGSSGSDRDLSCMVYDGSWGGDSNGATKETDVLDNSNNLQFPVVAYDKTSGSTNRVFFAVLNDTSGAYQINVGYHEGAVSSGSPPADTSNAWGTVKGPFATAVSDANYNKRPIMNMISTPEDGGMWIQYIEKSTPLGSNIKAIYSTDQFNTVSYHSITSNSYSKGHEMSSSADIGGTDYMYTTYHMTKGELENVNYDVYLTVYHAGFENDPDTQAPEVLRVASTPTIYDSSDGTYEINLKTNPSFDVVATADDGDTGRSGISSAYWMESSTSVSDPTTLDWSTATAMNMNAHTVVEKLSYVMNPCWQNNTVHRIWIKATDSAGNDGYSYIDLKVTGVPTMTVSFDNGWNLISLPWLSSPTSLSDALNGISWDRAMVYQNGHWYTYNTARDVKFNIGFPMIDNTMGLWVHTTSAGSITKEMQCLGTTSISLHKGWNLIGYPSKTADTVANIMSGFDGSYDFIEVYDASSGNIVGLSSSDNMEYGNGYWVHVTAPGTLTVNW